MPESEPRILELLRVLHEYQVKFIIVGGVGAVLHGAPISTFDLDLVHCREPDNLNRLMAALSDLDAHYRGHPNRLKPDADSLASTGHHLLITRLGPLDLLGIIEKGMDYSDLIPHSEDIQIENMKFQVLRLQFLIASKEQSSREKDMLKLRILKHTLIEREKRKT
jgi:predicted nucleotidyltransferase